MKQPKQPFFRLTTRMLWHKRQPIQPVFDNIINRFMYSPQQRHNNTKTIRKAQSPLSPTECWIYSTFDPFRTFHLFLHESIVSRRWFRWFLWENIYPHKTFETFQGFSMVSVHRKRNGARLLSPEIECTSYLTSCQTT